MQDQQEKVVFFPFHGKEGKLRLDGSHLYPAPFNGAGLDGGELESWQAGEPVSSASPGRQ